LAAEDGTEVVIQKEYQFPIQQKKGKKPKAKKEEMTEDAEAHEVAEAHEAVKPDVETETPAGE